MSKVIIGVVVIAVLAFGIYYYMVATAPIIVPIKNESAPPPPVVMNENASMTAVLLELNNSKESGDAAIVAGNNDEATEVSINIIGAPEGISQPAHFHSGTCTKPGGIVYSLNAATQGKSETSLVDKDGGSVSLAAFEKSLPLALVVHKSGTEMAKYVACGDFAPKKDEVMVSEAVIEITDKGFSPKELTIKAGTTVVFKNFGDGESWPASAKHPSHSAYPELGGCIGSKFDACKNLKKGESWSFQFNQKGSWGYHDHLRPTLFGKIIVE